MELNKAMTGLAATRQALRSQKGVVDPSFISEQMQRLTQYCGAVEEHLAQLEEQYEEKEMNLFLDYMKQGKSGNQAEILTKMELGKEKGQIARLRRYVNSSWQIVGVAQSRVNHLSKEVIGQV